MSEAIYDKSQRTTRRYRYDLRQKLSVAATSGRSTAIEAAEVLLHAKVAMHVTVGPSDVVANEATNTLPLEAGEKFHLQLQPGQFVAAIRDTADGALYIVPIDGRSV
ncbi:MAG: hypothetical protein ACK4Z5_05415 [Brevundimonas sp.]